MCVLILFLVISLQSRPQGPVGPVQYDGSANKLKSVPSSMLTDKYSFLGCLKVLKEVIGDKRRASQILSVYDLDKDLTQMGLSFIKDNRLIYRFQSPFAEMPCRVQDIDMFVPNEYLTNVHIREKLAEIKVKYTQNKDRKRLVRFKKIKRVGIRLSLILKVRKLTSLFLSLFNIKNRSLA